MLRRQNPLFALLLPEEAFSLRSFFFNPLQATQSYGQPELHYRGFLTLRVHFFSHHIKKIEIINQKMLDIRLMSQ